MVKNDYLQRYQFAKKMTWKALCENDEDADDALMKWH